MNLGRTEMDVFEQHEMARTRSAVKTKLNEWYDWIVDYVPESVKKPVSSAFSKTKNHIMRLYGDAKKKLGIESGSGRSKLKRSMVKRSMSKG